jgi:hydrogenase nickel incorporation protein HypA/HybF
MREKRIANSMHELSVAMNLVEIAEAAAQDAGVNRIQAVHLRLGMLSGIVKDSLLIAYEIAIENTVLVGSRLIIEDVPLVIYCPQCQAERELENIQLLECPVCGIPCADIRQGKEIELAFLEVLDETETA